METELRETIELVHQSAERCVIATAGAGSAAVYWLLSVPGASNTVLEALIPYSQRSFEQYLGRKPRQFVSADTSLAMAERALARARELDPDYRALLGIGCTAALRSLKPKRGAHRVHVGIQGNRYSGSYSLTLLKEARSREEEEEIAGRLVLHAISLAAKVLPRFDIPLLPGEQVLTQGSLSLLDEMMNARLAYARVTQTGCLEAGGETVPAILPGAFNPLHEGHRELAAAASLTLGTPVSFELSVENVDKPALSVWEILRRARQFIGWAPLLLTRAPTFRDKARLFPRATFVVGHDTAVRILSPRYYADEADMYQALDAIKELGCRFLVTGRLYDGAYRTLACLTIPEGYRDLFLELPESAFRRDISSTELRSGALG